MRHPLISSTRTPYHQLTMWRPLILPYRCNDGFSCQLLKRSALSSSCWTIAKQGYGKAFSRWAAYDGIRLFSTVDFKIDDERDVTSSSRNKEHDEKDRRSASKWSMSGKSSFPSLALSVYFFRPELGMKYYEILSRATAFLISVDPPTWKDHLTDTHADDDTHASDQASQSSGAKTAATGSFENFLKAAENAREEANFKSLHKHSPVQPTQQQRRIMDLGWLEFVPLEVRPRVHIVCSSHVVAPFYWKEYYSQPWLAHVQPEHVKYVLEVYNPAAAAASSSASSSTPLEPTLKLALPQQFPFHHPEGRDVALLHFDQEATVLPLLERHGIKGLHIRPPDQLFEKGEEILFPGYVVSERNPADHEQYTHAAANPTTSEADPEEDRRVFYPYTEKGVLSFHTKDRFFATTDEPLPEGLCGGPALDAQGYVCGVVEGIVPVAHEDKRLAGSAAFLPSYILQAFVDHVERNLLERMMPPDLFSLVVIAKKTNSIGGGMFRKNPETGEYTEATNYEKEYDATMQELRRNCTDEQFDMLMDFVRQQREAVLKEFDTKGGDLDQIIQKHLAKSFHETIAPPKPSPRQLQPGPHDSETSRPEEVF